MLQHLDQLCESAPVLIRPLCVDVTFQHRDAQGQIRTERDTADFRGTTVYASPFVHSGHDQCPRDDLFSAIHVFLDLVLGDLPWRTQAKAKDKAAVGALKMELMQDPDAFLNEVVRSFEASNASQGSVSEANSLHRSVLQ